ncbi:MAG: metallophosphoesterase, partial [Syntrophales bacterium]|nr:metallophosphoesterase [Syntrophales bacterium]
MYLIIYGTLHLHFYIRLAGTIPMTGRLRILVLGVLMVLFFSPILTRLSEGMGQGKIALAFSWGGYLWMGFVFLFFVLSLPLELWRLMASLGARRAVLPSPRVVFFLPMVMAVLLCGYGYLEARQIHVEHITIRASKPALAGKRIRIVQLSDVHVGLIVRGERLQAIIDAVRREEPHVVVSTGDLVDGQMDNLQEAEALFRNLQPPGGKYAVLGNHELYAGLNKALRFIEGGGFHILRGEAVMPLPGLYLAGVDDAVVVEAGLGKGKAVRDLGGAVPVGVFSLLLKHRPTVDEGGY